MPRHHIDLVTLNGSLELWGGLATDYPFSKLGRHLLNVVLVEAQFLADLPVRQVQPHEIQTQDPSAQG
jgi:hypothetical protein